MLEIRFSEPNDLELSGAIDELQKLRRAILSFIETNAVEITFDCDNSINATPYNFVLSKLVVCKSQLSVKVSPDNKRLLIEGSPQCLEAFASFLDFEANSKSGRHSHYEYYQGNQWIAPDSTPLVISIK